MKLHNWVSWASALSITSARVSPGNIKDTVPYARRQAQISSATTTATSISYSTAAVSSASPVASSTAVGAASAAFPAVKTHDGSFVPDAVLRVTEEERKQSCVPLKQILVVNGTSPGPTLRFKEGKTVWIRVYNDIPHQNLTMVSLQAFHRWPKWERI